MATIINKQTPVIKASLRTKGVYFITVKEKEIYFTKQVAFLLDLKKGQHIHFINDGSYWAFFINDDPDGFDLSYSKGFKICNRTLTNLFVSSTGCKFGDWFFITKSKSRQADLPIWEIYTSETLDVIVDKQKSIMTQRKEVLKTLLVKIKN